MFNRGKAKLKSISVAIAKSLGFLDSSSAEQANECLKQDGGEHPTLSLLIERGFLDEAQAAKVRAKRQKDHPLDELNENVKKARCAVRNAVPSRG